MLSSEQEVSSEGKSNAEEELVQGEPPAQPIYLHLFLSDKLGSKVLTGTTSDDPALLSKQFCQQWGLTK